jgi:hypothetical protein
MLRAAECVFALAIRSIEVEEVEERLTALERAAELNKGGRK